METLIKDIRYGIRGLLKRPGFTVIALHHARAWYRREYRDLQCRQCRLAAAAAVSRSRSARDRLGRRDLRWLSAQHARARKLRRLENTEPIVCRHGRESRDEFQSHGRRRARTRLRLCGQRQTSFRSSACSHYSVAALRPDEDRPGANKAAVLSYSLWQSRYGGDRNILNREILLNGEKHTVVGVMPASFQFFERTCVCGCRSLSTQEDLGQSRWSLPESGGAFETRRAR